MQQVRQKEGEDVIDADIEYEREMMSAVVEEQKQKAAVARANQMSASPTRVKAASPPRRASPASIPTRTSASRPKAAIPEPIKLQADGRYVIAVEEDWKAKTNVYVWTPPAAEVPA